MSKSLKRVISLILSIVIAFGANLIALAENVEHWKNKIDAKIYEKVTDKDSKVPVYVWLTDVDHNEVIEKTENTLGYGEKDLEVIDENISEELAVAISGLSEKEDDSVADELQKYMKKTEKKRKAEKEKTDKFISEKRKNYKDEYNKKSKDFLEKAKIADDDIIFRSQYAPMIISELTLKQIEKVAKSDNIEKIAYMKPVSVFNTGISMQELCDSTNISLIHNEIGLTGKDVGVGIVEIASVVTSDELPANRFFTIGIPYTGNDHIINTCKILAGTNGIAKNAIVYSCAVERGKYNSCDNTTYVRNFYGAIELLLDEDISVINSSFLISDGNDYGNINKWIDHVSFVHSVSFVASAGNTGEAERIAIENENYNQCIMAAPALSYNGITVGGYDNKNTESSIDDIMCETSSFNSLITVNNNRENIYKPDVVAPQNMLGGGTSSAAPFVSGIIALILELRPSLAAYPQIIKAILLSSCHHKALPAETTNDIAETMAQGITDKQGAGVVDAYRAISITGRGNYGIKEIGSGTTSTDIKFNVPRLYGATGINVSIAWLKNNTVEIPHDSTSSNIENASAMNVDLSILNGNVVLGTSMKENSSTEMVYISSPAAGTTYTARINKINHINSAVKVGYAWSFNLEQFQYTSENEGVFFLNNKQSGNYLHYSDTLISQKSFVGSFFYQVIIQSQNNGKYTINNFIGNTGCYDVGEPISEKYYAITYNANNTADITVQDNLDGSVMFIKTINGQQYILTVLNNSTSENAQIVWKRKDIATDIELAMCWHLEPVCYQVGDVDMDGQIEAEDSRTVLNYSSGNGSLGSDTFTNIVTYLADANSDGVVNAIDARLILRFSAGLE